MPTGKYSENAVSAVIGEMLMIAIVLILVAVFSSSIPEYLPSERSPTVTIMMSNDTSTITLWHKGGDWIRMDSLRIVVSNETGKWTYRLNSPNAERKFVPVPADQTFDLGANISLSQPLTGDETVTLATDRAVVFSGIIGRDVP